MHPLMRPYAPAYGSAPVYVRPAPVYRAPHWRHDEPRWDDYRHDNGRWNRTGWDHGRGGTTGTAAGTIADKPAATCDESKRERLGAPFCVWSSVAWNLPRRAPVRP